MVAFAIAFIVLPGGGPLTLVAAEGSAGMAGFAFPTAALALATLVAAGALGAVRQGL